MTEIHYSKIKPEDWHVQYFTLKEIACKQIYTNPKTKETLNCGCGGTLVVDDNALKCLDLLRDIIGVPFSPNSAYRCSVHNANVGGTPNSYHRKGMAFDIPIKGKMTREVIHRIGKVVGFRGFGDYNTFVHVDTGAARYWDMRKK